MNDLRESHDKTETAYQAALRQIATERISGKGMQDAFVKMFSEGNYGELQAAKSSYKTGRGLNSGAQYYYGDRVYDGRVQDRTTGKWRDMSATEKQQFEFARALSQVNDSQIKEVQALGAQSIAITEQIYQQDRAYNRLAGNNTPLRGGGSGGRGGNGGGTTKAEVQAVSGSIDEQTKKVQELQKAWRAAADDDSREKIKNQIEEQQYVLDRMTGKEKFDPTKMQQIKGMSVALPSSKLPALNLPDISNLKNEIQLELTAQNVKIDEAMLKTLLQDAFQNGIDMMDVQFAMINQKIANGVDVPDSAWQSILDQYNEIRTKIGQKPIQIDFNTGGIVNTCKETEKSWQAAAQAVQSVGSALQQVEDPGAKVAGIIANAIATIALTFAASLKGTFTPWDWIAGAAAGTATMISTIVAIKSATASERHAGGGFIGGKSYSGDDVMMPIENGGMAALSSGELILNRAQQGVIASQLENGNGGGMRVVGEIQGEKIVLVANRFLKRSGQGELVTWK
jgi:hypothetical protein